MSSTAKPQRGNEHFEDSYERLFGKGIPIGPHGARFFDAFYQRFLSDRDVRRLFADTDLAQQSRMMRMSLYQLVSFYLLGEPTAELERLAARHRAVGATDAMFQLWLEALLATVASQDPAFDAQVEQGWREALAPGIAYFKRHLTP